MKKKRNKQQKLNARDKVKIKESCRLRNVHRRIFLSKKVIQDKPIEKCKSKTVRLDFFTQPISISKILAFHCANLRKTDFKKLDLSVE